MFSPSRDHDGTIALIAATRFGLCWNTPVEAIVVDQLLARFDRSGSSASGARPAPVRCAFRICTNCVSAATGSVVARAGEASGTTAINERVRNVRMRRIRGELHRVQSGAPLFVSAHAPRDLRAGKKENASVLARARVP